MTLTVVGLAGGRTAGISDARVQGLDGRHAERPDVRVGLERSVRAPGTRAKARRPKEIAGRGAGGGCGRGRQAAELRRCGGGGCTPGAAPAPEAVRPHASRRRRSTCGENASCRVADSDCVIYGGRRREGCLFRGGDRRR